MAWDAVQSLTFCSITFHIFGHQILASDNIFVVPELPKCRMSIMFCLDRMGQRGDRPRRVTSTVSTACQKPVFNLPARCFFACWPGSMAPSLKLFSSLTKVNSAFFVVFRHLVFGQSSHYIICI